MNKIGDGNYDDGIFYYFGNNGQDGTLHVTAMMQTENPEVESCDIRLTQIASNFSDPNSTFKKEEWTDTLFYRFGYFNY